MVKVEKVMQTLDEAGTRLKLEKFRIAQMKTEWLGYKRVESGVKAIDKKCRQFLID